MSNPDSNDPPSNWDQLSDIDVAGIEQGPVSPPFEEPIHGPVVSRASRLTASWADLVVIAGATTSMIGAVILAGYPVSLWALPWSVMTALLGWGAVCGILLRVRRGTPGMLLAGFVFSKEITGGHLVGTVAAAGLSAFLLGLPALPGGPTSSLFSIASGSDTTPMS